MQIKPEVTTYDTRNPLRGISANFMNITLEINETSEYMIRKHDKRRSLPFSYTQFLKFRSNRPIRHSYNIIISQVLPILYVSNSVHYAAQEIELLMAIMVSNGFQEQRLRHLVLEWLKVNNFPLTKFSIVDTVAALTRFESAKHTLHWFSYLCLNHVLKLNKSLGFVLLLYYPVIVLIELH